MKKIMGKGWFYNSIPVLIWFLLLVLPFLSAPADIPAEAHRRFLIRMVSSNFLLLCLFYIHTYLIYPLIKSRGILWYAVGLAFVLGAYALYVIEFNNPHMGEMARQAGGFKDFGHGKQGHNSFNGHGGRNDHGGGRPGGGPFGFQFFLGPFVALLSSFCYRIILDNATRQQELKERETVHLQTELNFLRSQISPHFLFNVLNNLVSLARKKSDDLEPAIMNLSQLMRYMLYESDDNKVPLDKEIGYLKSYINLQMLRFGDEVKLHMNVAGNVDLFMIEPMLLIPFVENAFKHGTGMVEQPTILISLDVDDAKRTLHFKVINTVSSLDVSKDKASGIGLNNVRRRLDILYPTRHRLNIHTEDNHFTVDLSIRLD